MLKIRLLEEKIAEKYPEGEMRCPVHLSIGQEAIAVGVCAHLKQTDFVMSGHRAHAHFLAKGGDSFSLIAEIYGRKSGCANGRGGSMHLVDLDVNFLGSTPIVASSIPVATGVAFAEKMKGTKNITVVFFGEAAIEEGVTHEALNFASLKKLPILYVCENNLYSVYTHLRERQPARSISQLVAGHGVTVFSGNGNNIIEVYSTAKKAMSFLRTGQGPVFLEFATYRWREHCGPNYDNQIGYRTEKEFQIWKKTDPVAKLKSYLVKQKILSVQEITNWNNQIGAEIETLFQKVKFSPLAHLPVTENDVYAKN